jgi:hypothetical protein
MCLRLHPELSMHEPIENPDSPQTHLGNKQYLFALSDPTRLLIVKTLAENDELSCTSLRLSLNKSTACRHFQVLRNADNAKDYLHRWSL